MPSSSVEIFAKVRAALAKDLFRVEIHSNATGWLQIDRIIDSRTPGVVYFVPMTDPEQRIYLAVDEITAARISKAGDALAAGHTD